MNKKLIFLKKTLLTAMVIGLAVPSFTGCKDYDDDIDELWVAVNKNTESINNLKKEIENGALISDVTSDDKGITITLSNGNIYKLNHGTNGTNGINGKDGVNGTNGKDGVDGKDGIDGKTPIIGVNPSTNKLAYKYATADAWTDIADMPTCDITVDDFTFTLDDEGYLFLNGVKVGDVSLKGPQGETGTGINGVSVSEMWIDTEGILWWKDSNGNSHELSKVTGEKGETPALPSFEFQLDGTDLKVSIGGGAFTSIGKIDKPSFTFKVENGELMVNNETVAGFAEAVKNSIIANLTLTLGEDNQLMINGTKPSGVYIRNSFIQEKVEANTNTVLGYYLNMPDENGTFTTIYLPKFSEGYVLKQLALLPTRNGKISLSSLTCYQENAYWDPEKHTDENKLTYGQNDVTFQFRLYPAPDKSYKPQVNFVFDRYVDTKAAGFSVESATAEPVKDNLYEVNVVSNGEITTNDIVALKIGNIASNYMGFEVSNLDFTTNLSQNYSFKFDKVEAGFTNWLTAHKLGYDNTLGHSFACKYVNASGKTLTGYTVTYKIVAQNDEAKTYFVIDGMKIKAKNSLPSTSIGIKGKFHILAMVGSGILDDQEIEITLSYPDEDSEYSAIVPSIILPNMKDMVVGADKAPILSDDDRRTIAQELKISSSDLNTKTIEYAVWKNKEHTVQATDIESHGEIDPDVTKVKPGTYYIVITVKDGTKEILTATKEVTIKVVQDQTIEQVIGYWDNNQARILGAEIYGTWRMQFKLNDALKVGTGYEIKYTVTSGNQLVNIANGVVVLKDNVALAQDRTVTIKAEIVDKGGNIVSKQAETYTLVFVSPFKNSKFDSKAEEYTLYNEDENALSIDLSKEISLSTTIGKEYVIIDNTGKIDDTNAALFGVETPQYKLTTPNTNLTIKGGTITWTPSPNIGAQFQGFDAQVKITIKNKYNDLTKTITIHVKPGKSPAVEE